MIEYNLNTELPIRTNIKANIWGIAVKLTFEDSKLINFQEVTGDLLKENKITLEDLNLKISNLTSNNFTGIVSAIISIRRDKVNSLNVEILENDNFISIILKALKNDIENIDIIIDEILENNTKFKTHCDICTFFGNYYTVPQGKTNKITLLKNLIDVIEHWASYYYFSSIYIDDYELNLSLFSSKIKLNKDDVQVTSYNTGEIIIKYDNYYFNNINIILTSSDDLEDDCFIVFNNLIIQNKIKQIIKNSLLDKDIKFQFNNGIYKGE